MELQNPMSTRARIKRDKRLYELGVKGPKATKLPARIKDQLVEDLCYEFDITEPTQIIASLRKMKKVIEIAPKMEHVNIISNLMVGVDFLSSLESYIW